jgi:hypothetical protein
MRGEGTGQRQLFDTTNLVEGSMLLALQEVLGERSPWPGRLIQLIRDEAPTIADRLLAGDIPKPPDSTLIVMLWPAAVLKNRKDGSAFVILDSLQNQMKVISGAVAGGATVSLLSLEQPLSELRRRLAENH